MQPAGSYQAWLARIIEEWQPHIVHTLGFDPAAFFYLETRNAYPPTYPVQWIMQARGGPDLALNRLLPEYSKKISDVLSLCSQFIADNERNYGYAVQMGLDERKISPLGVVPGTGGIDVDVLKDNWRGLPSKRERIVIWPKAYESPQSKALPVLEALRTAWDRIEPCKVIMTAAIQEEVRIWYATLPDRIRSRCSLSDRVPRNELLRLMGEARVLLSPSLSDGIPNSLYEAMATGCFPVFSPLETISAVVKNEMNVLFARNLYPDEIADALVRAMNDDLLVDRAAEENLALVKRVADREVLRPHIIACYEEAARAADEARAKTGRTEEAAVAEWMAPPLVTIITPAYNRADFLEETIESVLSQDYPHIEYIVLDDGSTDDTPELLEKYGSLIRSERHANMGETRTVNKGFAMARGEIVCVVNSDDPLLPGAVREAVNFLETYPDALAAYSDWLEIDSDSRPISEIRLPDFDILTMLTRFNVGMGPGTFIRKRAFDLVGFRDTAFRYAGDLEFWFRLALNGRLVHIGKILATHRTHSDSASVSSKGAQMSNELIRMTKKVTGGPRVIEEIRRQRRKFLSKAHSAAVSYCGRDRMTAFKHRIAAFCYDPGPYVRQFLTQCLILPVFGSVRRMLLLIASIILPTLRIPLFLVLRIESGISSATRGRSRREVGTPAKKRFCLVSHVLPPSWSGQAVAIGRLLAEVDPATYCLVSLNDYAKKRNDRFIEALGGAYHRIAEDIPDIARMEGRRKRLALLYAAFMRGWRIARIANQERCSALLGASGNIADLPAAYLASRLLGIPFFPYLFDDYVYQWQDPTFRSFAETFASLIFPNSKSVIVPNEFLAREIRRRYSASTTIIRNPCETGQPGNKMLCRKELGPSQPPCRSESQDGNSIVYTGAIYYVNFGAFRNLISAMDDPGLSNLPNLALHLYTAQSRDYLAKEGISGTRIEYHEHVLPTKVAEAQARAGILFVPFAFDSSVAEIVKTSAPGKLGDYLASGRPILAHVPPNCFVAWYLKKYECGLVVDRDDPAELAHVIRRLLEEKKLGAYLGENARKRALIDFVPALARRRFLELVNG